MRRTLGKGLSQLLSEPVAEPASSEAPIESIRPNPRQPRSHFEPGALEELAASIREHGILQPLLVSDAGDGTYVLIAGERRLRAARLAGLKAVPIVVRAAGDQGSLELALIENVQREDISPLEAARAYRKLIDEFGLTQDKVAQRVGKSRVAIANAVRLLKLPAKIQDGLESGAISEGHARALLQVDNVALQLALFDKIVGQGLTVRDVEQMAQRQTPDAKKKAGRRTPARDPEWAELEEGMSTYFGAPVRLKKQAQGGQITIEFFSDDELDRILDRLGIRL